MIPLRYRYPRPYDTSFSSSWLSALIMTPELIILMMFGLFGCHASGDNNSRLITSSPTQSSTQSADAVASGSQLPSEDDQATKAGYPSIAQVKEVLGDHNDSTSTTQTSSHSQLSKLAEQISLNDLVPAFSSTAADPHKHPDNHEDVEDGGHHTDSHNKDLIDKHPASSQSPSLSSLNHGVLFSKCQDIKQAQLLETSTTDHTTDDHLELTKQPTILFTNYPLAGSFNVHDLSSTEPSPLSFHIKTRSMDVEFADHIKGELTWTHSLSGSTSAGLEFADQKKLNDLSHLKISWKVIVEATEVNSHTQDESQENSREQPSIESRLASTLKTLINQGVVVRLNDLIELQAQELIFPHTDTDESSSFHAEILKKEPSQVILAELEISTSIHKLIDAKQTTLRESQHRQVSVSELGECAEYATTTAPENHN